MKRGFLKAKAKARATQTKPVVNAEKTVDKPKVDVDIPTCPPIPAQIPTSVPVPHDILIFTVKSLNLPVTIFLGYGGTREKMMEELKPFSTPKTVAAVRSMPVSVKEIHGQGRGLIANRSFDSGDFIMHEDPFFVAPAGYPIDSRPIEMLTMATENFSPQYKDIFYRLHNCKSSNPRDAKGIMDTNALPIGCLPGPYRGEWFGMFPVTSRANHSCVPNAYHKWDLNTFTYQLHALRPIAIGEQIYIHYLHSLYLPRSQRQNEMKSKYSFTCTCTCCSLSGPLSLRSDIKRKLLESALQDLVKAGTRNSEDTERSEKALKVWIDNPSLADDHIYKHPKMLMQYMEDEQAIHPLLWLSQAEIACKALCALGEREGVVELAKKTAKYAKAYFLVDDGGWGKVAMCPEGNVWWGLRKKVRVE